MLCRIQRFSQAGPFVRDVGDPARFPGKPAPAPYFKPIFVKKRHDPADAMLGAPRRGAALSAFPAEGALDGRPSFPILFHHPERAGFHTGTAAGARRLPYLDGSVLFSDDRLNRASCEAGSLIAVLA